MLCVTCFWCKAFTLYVLAESLLDRSTWKWKSSRQQLVLPVAFFRLHYCPPFHLDEDISFGEHARGSLTLSAQVPQTSCGILSLSYWFPFSLVTESHYHLTATPCLLWNFILLSLFTSLKTKRTTSTCTSCGIEQPLVPTELSVWRIAVETSQAFLCRHSLDSTWRNYFSIFLPIKTHSITRSRWKATDTGYFAGLSYHELHDI